MNKLNLIIENAAESDMIAIAKYIAKDRKSIAAKMLKLFYTSFDKLSTITKVFILQLHHTNTKFELWLF